MDLVRDGIEATGKTCEVILVVDGEQPERLAEALALADLDDGIQVLRFERGFGEGAALSAGLRAAQAPIVLTHPAYFQTVGEVIPKLVEEIERGADVAIASRAKKSESIFNRAQRWLFNATLRLLFGVKFRDLACGLRVMRREALEEISVHGGWQRFLVVAAVMRGLRVREVEADVHPSSRRFSPYSPFTYFGRMLDVAKFFFLTKFVHRPMRFFGPIGAPMLLVGFVLCAYLSVLKIFYGEALGSRPLFMLGAMLVAFGLQILAIGLLAEIITYSRSTKTKPYVVREVRRREPDPEESRSDKLKSES
jgi:glycosyltransferase involved in cell wall biosynthesis